MKRHAIIGLVISLAALAWVLRGVDFARLWELAKGVNPLYVLAVNALLALSFWVRSLRWQVLLHPVGHYGLGPLMSANLIGFMANDVLPARLGELVRTYAASRLTGAPMAGVLGTIVVERVLDGLTLVMVLFITLLFADPAAQAGSFSVAYMRSAGYFLLAAYLGVLAVVGCLWRWPAATLGLIGRLAGRITPGLAARLTELLTAFAQGLAVLGRWRALLWLSVLSLGVWAPFFFMYGVFLPAVGLPFDPFMAAMALTGGTLAAAVPAGPGYVGTFQLACLWALMIAGADRQRAEAYVFIYWAVQYFPLVIAGLVEMYRRGMRLGSLQSGGEALADQ